MADGALEGEAFADGTLRAPDLTPAVAAVHAELWRGGNGQKERHDEFPSAKENCTL